MKDCGSCGNFTKWRNDKFSGGVCEFHDQRTNTDSGKKCANWCGIKYDRKKSLACDSDMCELCPAEINKECEK